MNKFLVNLSVLSASVVIIAIHHEDTKSQILINSLRLRVSAVQKTR